MSLLQTKRMLRHKSVLAKISDLFFVKADKMPDPVKLIREDRNLNAIIPTRGKFPAPVQTSSE